MNAPAHPTDPPMTEPGKRPTSGAKRGDENDEDEWRHEPVAPVNEANPLRSLGEAVGETVTGSGQDTAKPRKR